VALPSGENQRHAASTSPFQSGMHEQAARLSHGHDLVKAANYMLKRWPAFTLFLEDGRVCLSNNAAERGLRGIVMLESLCIPSSSVCKHWNRVVVSDATRATFSGHRRFDRFRRQVVGANLVWRAAYNLHRGQHAGFDQAAYRVACDA
jgi:transposase